MKNIGFILLATCCWLLTLPAWGGSNGTAIPQETAARFCQLLINDGESIMPLSAHARRVIEPCDSLTCEQLFVEFLLRDDNWQSLRLFPHRQDDGTIIWYAPGEELPASMDAEHQKYIREVFPRLLQEIKTERWENVDAYIDLMQQYQCQFGGTKLSPKISSITILSLIILFSVIIFLCRPFFVSLQAKLVK